MKKRRIASGLPQDTTPESDGEDITATAPYPESAITSTARQLFYEIGVVDLLDQDLRPTFVLDLADIRRGTALRPFFFNALLASSPSLKDVVLGRNSPEHPVPGVVSYQDFRDWAVKSVSLQSLETSLLSLAYQDMLWKSSTLKGRWRVITGIMHSLSTDMSAFAHTPSFLGLRMAEMPNWFTSKGLEVDGLVKVRASVFGMSEHSTSVMGTVNVPAHIQLLHDFNWASTALGSIDQWTSQLRLLVDMILSDPIPAVLLWGANSIMIYNEAYVSLLGTKHPSAMGCSGAVCLPEVWDQVQSLLDEGYKTRKPVRVEDTLFLLNRNGFIEETYFYSTFMPLIGADGSIVGFYESVLETTQKILTQRRDQIIRLIKEEIPKANTVKDFWVAVTRVFDAHDSDITLASLYSTGKAFFTKWQSFSSSTTYLEINTTDTDMISLFQSTLNTDNPNIIYAQDASFPDKFLKLHNITSDKIVVCKLNLTSEIDNSDILFLGMSPRIPPDDSYKSFVHDLIELLSMSMITIAAAHSEREHKELVLRQNDANQKRLAEELRLRSLEVKLEETKFSRLAESAPVGIWIGKPDGSFKFRNPKWYEITKHSGEMVPFYWEDLLHESQASRMQEFWKEISDSKAAVSFELQLKRAWMPPETSQELSPVTCGPAHAWVLASAQPNEFSCSGEVTSIVGVLTDISHQKWAEGEQARRMKDALEAKRQQDAFVDMVSHEIRNPLSAILISADGIEDTFREVKSFNGPDGDIRSKTLDAARIIIHCVQHQKRIIDDILSLSKLDSDLLLITPISAQPVQVARDALNMLSSEAENDDISTELLVDGSCQLLNVDWVLLDPSRLTQVLINLLTNAFKFTRTRPKRKITLTISASLQRPSNSSQNEGEITYVPSKDLEANPLSNTEFMPGNKIFVQFAVRDTGLGLSIEEQKVLFKRFSQATPRTHVQYGGSGLGLFISKTLVEKQGGEIGVSSERGVGSTFAFYILARLVPPSAATGLSSIDSPGSALGARRNTVSRVVPKILIVEDNITNQKVMSRQLQQQGCVVYIANHGGEAISIMEESNRRKGKEKNGKEISVVLMDQQMPIMDGITCVRIIREMESDGRFVSHIPVIGVTANARTEQVEELKSAGMDDVVLKPFRIAELMSRIDSLIG